ncbi:hypothetical protein DRJ04_06535, partial [Candidatus Aerophobetes bacterium]
KKFKSRRGKEQGGREFIDTYIQRVLKNPVYIGKIQYKGVIYEGKHCQPRDKSTHFSPV